MRPHLPTILALVTLAGALRAQAQTPGFERLPSGTEYQLFRRGVGGSYQRRPLVVPTDSAYSMRQGKYLLEHLAVLTG